MALKKKTKTSKKAKSAAPHKETYLRVLLNEAAEERYKKYMMEVIEERAIFGKVDGVKPVTRRILWAAYKLGLHHKAKTLKAAKIVGDTMGSYHPHGDSSIYQAMVTANNSVLPMFDGSGNWGNMIDEAAAPRYTNSRLSLFSDRVFFDPFYLPVTEYIDNYDDTTQEPLNLPTLLPNALINGNFGIAPGVQASSPIVTFPTIIKALLKSIKKGATVETCKDLELTTTYGGVVMQHDNLKADMKAFLKTGKGRFKFDCQYKEINDTEIRIFGFPFAAFDESNEAEGKKRKKGRLERLEDVKGVANVRDDTDKNDRNVAFVVTFKKTLSLQERKIAMNEVLDVMSNTIGYNMQVTDRTLHPDKEATAHSKLEATSIPKLLDDWINYRVDLEKKACRHWIDKRKVEIERLELMVFAVINRDKIIKALDKKLEDGKLDEYLAKLLKITVEQAKIILDLRIRSLKALELDTLRGTIKAKKVEINGYRERIKKPRDYIHGHVKSLSTELGNEYTA